MGAHPWGTITFTLFLNGGGAPVHTEMVSVTGNGTYATPTGLSLWGVGGHYESDASYSGDSNNNAMSDTGAPGEQVVVSQASPGRHPRDTGRRSSAAGAAPGAGPRR